MLVKRNFPVFPTFDRVFDDIFNNDISNMFDKLSTVPAVNIKERDKDYVIELAAPGMKKEDFEIELDNNILTVSSKKKEEKVEEKSNYTKREFNYCGFQRMFTLPETANIEDIKAEYKDGILVLLIAKKPEAQIQPKRKIDIN